MAIQVSGRIYKIFETNQVSERFSKRELVLEIEDGKYPQMILLQCTGDRCSNLDEYDAGDEVSVDINLRGREWTSPKGEVRYFNSLDVWRIALTKKGSAGETASPPPDDAPDMDADIPF